MNFDVLPPLATEACLIVDDDAVERACLRLLSLKEKEGVEELRILTKVRVRHRFLVLATIGPEDYRVSKRLPSLDLSNQVLVEQ